MPRVDTRLTQAPDLRNAREPPARTNRISCVWFIQAVGGARGKPPLAGGGVWHLHSMAREFLSRGVRVVFLTNNHDKLPEVPPPFFSRIIRLPSVGSKHEQLRSIDLINVLIQWKRLLSLRKEITYAPTAVISGSPFLPDVVAIVLLTWLRRALPVISMHHVIPPPWWFPKSRGSPIRVLLLWAQQNIALVLAKLVGAAVIINTTQRNSLQRLWPRATIITDYGVLSTPPPFRQPNSAEKIRKGWDACFIGRPSPQKGFSDLLKVWSLLHKNHPRRRLIALLPSTSPETLRKTKRVLTSLRFEGSVELRVGLASSERDHVLSDSRLLILPSYEEGWSLTAMEAAREGVPIICYNLPAYDYLNGSLLTAPVGNTLELVKCVERVWNDPSAISLLVKTASKAIEVYDASHLADAQLREFLEAWTRRNKKEPSHSRKSISSTDPLNQDDLKPMGRTV